MFIISIVFVVIEKEECFMFYRTYVARQEKPTDYCDV